MRLLACLIVAPQRGYDEPAILSYAISSFCPTSADGLHSASEKFEIIELVEQSSLSIRRTLAPIGIPRSTFYDWYSRYQEGGIEALVDGKPRPRRIWNKIPDKIETAIVNLALEEPDLSPRELAVNFTDTKG